ncbi:MAG: GNAT family N-acetyltransferase [Glaciimonas sp.]|nr:GNAT family N-acetyltransferase [Glaciimonas sp.]
MQQHTRIQIKAITAADHQAWLPLWQAYQTFYEQPEIPASINAVTWQRLLDPAEAMFAALAFDDDKAIGLVQWLYHRTTWSIQDRCYLGDLFVAPSLRGHGVGRQLIEHVYTVAEVAGCSLVYWQTRDTNHTARQLYNRVANDSGFVVYKKPLKTT